MKWTTQVVYCSNANPEVKESDSVKTSQLSKIYYLLQTAPYTFIVVILLLLKI